MKLIKISAMWCPGCLILNKTIKKLKDNYPNLEVTDYDYDFDSEEVKYYNPGELLPVLIFTDDNDKELKRLVGERSEQDIISALEELGYE